MAFEFSFKDPLVESFALHATVCVLKLMAMALLTAYRRISNNAFATQEDVARFKGKVAVNNNHPLVERATRNHLNDIENIIPFVLIGLFYVMTGPSLAMAKLHFRIFTVARFVHTFVYQCGVPQPARALAHMVSMAICFSMGYQVIAATMKAF